MKLIKKKFFRPNATQRETSQTPRRNGQNGAQQKMEPHQNTPRTKQELQGNLHSRLRKVQVFVVRSKTGNQRRNGSLQKSQHPLQRTQG